MKKNIAVISDGIVVNILEQEEEIINIMRWIILPDNAGIGSTYVDGVFSNKPSDSNQNGDV